MVQADGSHREEYAEPVGERLEPGLAGTLVKAAPSYYIEGLLYSVPNDKFGTSYGDTFCNCLNWLVATDRSKLTCANQQYWLLGNSNVQWSAAKCDQFLNALVTLWKNW